MAIPDFQSIMLPLLKLIAKNPYSSTISLAESLARSFALSIKRKRNFNQVARELCFMIKMGNKIP
jgi:restriction endonuclease Mrr